MTTNEIAINRAFDSIRKIINEAAQDACDQRDIYSVAWYVKQLHTLEKMNRDLIRLTADM